MNLRILKKLSKRAAPHLASLGIKNEQFPAERWEDYTESSGHDRKHRERRRARFPMEPRDNDKHLAAAKTMHAKGDGRRLVEFALECAAIGDALATIARSVLQEKQGGSCDT